MLNQERDEQKISKIKEPLIDNLSDSLTYLTDYLADPKIKHKDLAATNELLYPFKAS